MYCEKLRAQLLCRVAAYTRQIAWDDLPTINDGWTMQKRHTYPHKFAAFVPLSVIRLPHDSRAARLGNPSPASLLALAETSGHAGINLALLRLQYVKNNYRVAASLDRV